MTFIFLNSKNNQWLSTKHRKKKDYISVALSWKIPQQCFSSKWPARHQKQILHPNSGDHCWASLVWKGSDPCCGECASFLGSQADGSPSSHPGGWDPHPLPESPRGMLGTWSFTAFWSQSKDWASCQGHKKICKWVQKSPRWVSILCALFWVHNRGSTAGSVLTSH